MSDPNSNSNSNPNPLQVLFLGTGCSSGLPLTPCLTLSSPYPEAWTDMVPLLEADSDARSRSKSSSSSSSSSSSRNAEVKGTWDPHGPYPRNIPCSCCRSAVDKDVPEGWKNKRGNVSVVLRKKKTDADGDGGYKNVLVDVGKTFRENAARFFPAWGVKTIDAVLLTHGHADAFFGLDDLREWCVRQKRAIPVYLNKSTYENVASTFPYMVDKTKASGGGDIPTLLWRVIDDETEFDVEGIIIKTLPVYHGVYFHTVTPGPEAKAKLEPEPLICLGFMFDNSVIYLSDVSSIPEKTWERMLDGTSTSKKVRTAIRSETGLNTPRDTPPNGGSPTRTNNEHVSESFNDPTTSSTNPNPNLPILIVDALWPLRSHPSHFGLAPALETAFRLKPKFTYLFGSTHPTSHFMWEEICRSLPGPATTPTGGKRQHPDRAQADWLVDQFQKRVLDKNGLKEKWEEYKGIVRPAWDGLVLDVPRTTSNEQEVDGEVENHKEGTRGLVF